MLVISTLAGFFIGEFISFPSWTKNNISYYLAGNDLTTKELLSIGESIGYNNQTVSKEK